MGKERKEGRDYVVKAKTGICLNIYFIVYQFIT